MAGQKILKSPGQINQFHDFFFEYFLWKSSNLILVQKIFLWNWFIWFHEFFFGLDFFKFSGPLWTDQSLTEKFEGSLFEFEDAQQFGLFLVSSTSGSTSPSSSAPFGDFSSDSGGHSSIRSAKKKFFPRILKFQFHGFFFLNLISMHGGNDTYLADDLNYFVRILQVQGCCYLLKQQMRLQVELRLGICRLVREWHRFFGQFFVNDSLCFHSEMTFWNLIQLAPLKFTIHNMFLSNNFSLCL